MPDWQKLLWIAAAGAVGTLARWGLQGWVQDLSGSAFPWGTLAVNAAGCFLFGFIWTLAEERFLLSPQVRIIALTGFMGAFTTFSTFAFETTNFVRASQWGYALANLALQNGVGIFCVLLGFVTARWF